MLHISQIIRTLAVTKPLSTIVIGMHNFIAKFRNILEIYKKFAENLSITAEAFSMDSENYPFNRLNKECPGAIPNLITRRQFNQHMHYFNSTNEFKK